MAEKSEGELSDSDEEGEVNSPPSKKLKSAPLSSVPTLREEARPQQEQRRETRPQQEQRRETRPQQEQRRETRRERRKRKKSERKLTLKGTKGKDDWTCELSPLARYSLDFDQTSILAQLASLIPPPPLILTSPLTSHTPHTPTPTSPPITHTTPSAVSVSLPPLTSEVRSSVAVSSVEGLQILKTGKLQGIILHVMLGAPWLVQHIEGVHLLYSCPVAILWLSMVSAELFFSRPEVFSGLKSLRPQVQFLLQHPGSAYFAKLGIESFMFMGGLEGEKRRQGEGRVVAVRRTNCLLDYDAMRESDFPMPSYAHSRNTSDGTTYSSPHSDTSPAPHSYFRLCESWPASVEDAVNGYPMFAVDCEMVQTRAGLELARVSLVDENLQCVYDKLVKPDNPVLDYKTEYSGVTAETLADVPTTLRDVHRDLFHLLPPHCILVGHSLENDLHALKMTHPYIIDTSSLFLSSGKCQYKPKLRMLAKRMLGVDIQVGSDGHSSVQDARTCMELVLKTFSDGKPVSVDGRSILTEIASFNHSVAIVDRPSIVRLFGPHTSGCPVPTDEDTVIEAKKALSQHNLTFLQLHSYEEYIKSTKKRECEHEAQRVLRQMDAEVLDIVDSCQSGTLVLVVCGSGDIRAVKELQQSKQQRERLREAVAVARTGLAMAFVVK